MPTVKVKHSTTKDPQTTFQKIKEFFQTDETLKKLDSKMSFNFNEAQMSGEAKGSQFKANFNVKPSSAGSDLEVNVELPLLLTPFKGKVEETIQKKLPFLVTQRQRGGEFFQQTMLAKGFEKVFELQWHDSSV